MARVRLIHIDAQLGGERLAREATTLTKSLRCIATKKTKCPGSDTSWAFFFVQKVMCFGLEGPKMSRIPVKFLGGLFEHPPFFKYSKAFFKYSKACSIIPKHFQVFLSIFPSIPKHAPAIPKHFPATPNYR